MTNTLTLTGKGPNPTVDMTVAQTILEQLGGKRFVLMTGAHNFSSDGTMIQFNIKAKNKAKCNSMVIHYNKAQDTYNVQFWNFTMPRLNVKTGNITGGLKVIKKVEGVYCDMLQELFTDVTGLYTRL